MCLRGPEVSAALMSIEAGGRTDLYTDICGCVSDLRVLHAHLSINMLEKGGEKCGL